MTYDSWITRLRRQNKDHGKPMHNDFTGDGTTVQFQCTDHPILESSYIVKVNGTQKTEGSDYVLDRESGLITFTVAPTDTHPITIDFKYVHVTNAGYIEITNAIIQDMEGSFFKEINDESFGVSVAEDVTVAGPTKCIDVFNFFYRTSDNESLRWTPVSTRSSWRYSKDLNKILLGSPFLTAGYPLRLCYLKGYTLGTSISDTLDMQDVHLGVLEHGCQWKYYDYRLADRVEIETKLTQERTITPLQNLQALSSHYRKIYEDEKRRKKPTKPAMPNMPRVPGSGIA